jgi:hypothetical protein
VAVAIRGRLSASVPSIPRLSPIVTKLDGTHVIYVHVKRCWDVSGGAWRNGELFRREIGGEGFPARHLATHFLYDQSETPFNEIDLTTAKPQPQLLA